MCFLKEQMNDSNVNQEKRINRPLIIVIFCIFVILTHGVDLIRSFNIDRFLDLLTYVPLWYLLLLLIAIYPCEIFGVIEIWKMRRRGLLIFGSSQLLWLILWIFYFNLLPNFGQITLLAIFGLIILIYNKNMD